MIARTSCCSFLRLHAGLVVCPLGLHSIFAVEACYPWRVSASTATGPGTFNDIVWNNPNGTRATVAAAMANPPSTGCVTPLPRTLRRPAGDMVIDGVQQGSEVLGVNPSGNVAEICYDALGFIVDGQEFGKVTELVVDPDCPLCSGDYQITGLPSTQLTVGQQYNVGVSTTTGDAVKTVGVFTNSTTQIAGTSGNGIVFTLTQEQCDAIDPNTQTPV